jgi:hypothetical protein
MPDPFIQHIELRNRLISNILIGIVLAGTAGMCAWYFVLRPDQHVSFSSFRVKAAGIPFFSALDTMKDTVYTSMPTYLLVDLDSQRVTHYRHGNSTEAFRASTGNSNLPKGIETRTGIFLIQQRMDSVRSKQFGNTKILNWLGFNLGVGFHSLEGKGYYRNLGKRPTSHGCIRLSSEDAEHLFSEVRIGTPVIVQKDKGLRVVAFRAENDVRDTASFSQKEISRLLQLRLNDLCKGRMLSKDYPPVLLDRRYVSHNGIPLGSDRTAPVHQDIPKVSHMFTLSGEIW